MEKCKNTAMARRFFQAIVLIIALSAVPSSAADTVVRATLKNGLRVVIVKNTLSPVVTTEMNYLVGADEDPKDFPGMAHALEHMMFRGSPGLSADQLSRIVAALGGEFNAGTGQTYTQYFFTVPVDGLDVALNIEAVRMKGILATQKLWEEERGAMEQEVAQDLSNPEYIFNMRLKEALFAGTPYRRDGLGTKESFDKTTGEMLKGFHERWYAPNNAVLVIVGDVDPAGTLSKVRGLFEEIPARPSPERPAVSPGLLKASAIELETDLPYGMAVVAYRLPGIDSPDYAAGQVLADVLNSRRGELYALVPEGKALSVSFEGDVYPKGGYGFVSAAYPQGGDGAKAAKTVKGIIDGYLKNGLPADLVEAAKRHEVADAEFLKNSVEGLASVWSQVVAVEGRNSPDEDIELIKKVTVDDVNRVAREYLVNSTATVGILTPRPSGKAVSTKSFSGAESFTPKEVKAVALPQWAKKAATLPELPASTVKPVVTALPNGIRLIVQSESISDTISVYGRIKTNPLLQAPGGKEGVAQVLQHLFPFGTKKLDRVAFQKALDDIAADESAGTGFTLRVLKDYFEKGVELLADNELNPALGEKDFMVVREETADSLEGTLQSPSYISRRTLLSALYPKDDPALREATPKTVSALTLDDVKSYYASVFRPDMTTIVVIGSITPEEARRVVGKYFGGWKAEGPKPATDLPPAALNKPSSHAVPDESRVQAGVTLAETLGIRRQSPEYYPLQVGRSVLAGAFYATRLYRDLREESGLVYTVEAELQAGKARSVFSVVYASDPKNVSRARAIIERDIRDMQAKEVSPEELLQAKTLLLRQVPLRESSTDSIASMLLNLAAEDLPLDETVRAARRYREMTAAEVKSAFSKVIRLEDFVQITVGPEPQ